MQSSTLNSINPRHRISVVYQDGRMNKPIEISEVRILISIRDGGMQKVSGFVCDDASRNGCDEFNYNLTCVVCCFLSL